MKSYGEAMGLVGRCSVCGGEGIPVSQEAVTAPWLGRRVRHTDPDECVYYLELRRKDLERREAALPKSE